MWSLLRNLFGTSEDPSPVQLAPPLPTIPGITEVDQMEGKAFEEYLDHLFTRLGYQVERTPYYDRGADLIASKGGVRTAIQAKRWKGDVDVHSVRAVVASMRPYNCSRAMVVTNASYTLPARQCARDNGVELWDRRKLIEVLEEIGVEQPVGSRDRVCHKCGEPVSEKVADYCLSQPGRFRGKVYCYGHQWRGQRAKAS